MRPSQKAIARAQLSALLLAWLRFFHALYRLIFHA